MGGAGWPLALAVVEHDRGELAPATLEALTFARSLAKTVHALVIGGAGAGLAAVLGEHGAAVVHVADDALLADYGPEAWGHTVASAVAALAPAAVVATGTDRGNEVLAHAAARLDQPFAANCLRVEAAGSGAAAVTRVRWGGSLLEDAELAGSPLVVTVAHHHVEAVPAPVEVTVAPLAVAVDPALARTTVVERVERGGGGLTLATAPVVVGGGRGVGSAEGFAVLEELAAELGGVVGCSRAVTNNGWRSHADQVGQTGTRIAADLYIACGISGAIQHWVGAMGAKHILAVNTDPAANMVTKADYAVIGDLHQVVPAITAEIRRRTAG